ncbi:MAG: hypothetical protein QXF17_05015 [Ignisphaera sp.]
MEDEFSRLFDRIEKRLRRIEDQLLRDVEETLKRVLEIPARRVPIYGESIEPLYTVRDFGDRIVIYVDLPGSSEGTIDVKFEDRKTYVTAKLREAIELGKIFGRYRDIEVREYSLVIDLPFEPRPEKTKVRSRKGVIEITLYR